VEAGGFGGTIRGMILLLAWENQGNPMRTLTQGVQSPGVVIIIFNISLHIYIVIYRHSNVLKSDCVLVCILKHSA
jgi:hypothetical protein